MMKRLKSIFWQVIGWMDKYIPTESTPFIVLASFFAVLALGPANLESGRSGILIAISGGILAFAVLVQTMRRAKAAEDENIQKIFSDAIKHLGNKKASVVLGGVYSLLDLAKDMPDYRHKVFMVLCAHIRTATRQLEYMQKNKYSPSPLIQEMLDLLFCKDAYRDLLPGRANISGSWLRGAQLSGAKLNKAIIEHVQLRGAMLAGAELREAHLKGTWLLGADMRHATLTGADLEDVRMHGADLFDANLRATVMRNTVLSCAHLCGAKMQAAYMDNVVMHCADLHSAKIQGVILKEVHLQGARLYETGMQFSANPGGNIYCHGAGQSPFESTTSTHEPLLGNPMTLGQRIMKTSCKKTDLSKVIFYGGITKQEHEDVLADIYPVLKDGRDLSIERALLEKWISLGECDEYIDAPPGYTVPRPTGIQTGSYQDPGPDVDVWIKEYKDAFEDSGEGIP